MAILKMSLFLSAALTETNDYLDIIRERITGQGDEIESGAAVDTGAQGQGLLSRITAFLRPNADSASEKNDALENICASRRHTVYPKLESREDCEIKCADETVYDTHEFHAAMYSHNQWCTCYKKHDSAKRKSGIEGANSKCSILCVLDESSIPEGDRACTDDETCVALPEKDGEARLYGVCRKNTIAAGENDTTEENTIEDVVTVTKVENPDASEEGEEGEEVDVPTESEDPATSTEETPSEEMPTATTCSGDEDCKEKGKPKCLQEAEDDEGVCVSSNANSIVGEVKPELMKLDLHLTGEIHTEKLKEGEEQTVQMTGVFLAKNQ